jgi:hypothetical protein
MEMAIVDCEIPADEFYNLTLYELHLYIERARRRSKRESIREELAMNRTRILWAPLMNAIRDHKRKKTPFTPQDLVKLSFDQVQEEQVTVKPDTKQMKEALGAKFK